MKFPPDLSHLGYTEEELERDNPHNQWMSESDITTGDLDGALAELNRRIVTGQEFPAAHPLVCLRFNIDPAVLIHAYDEQFSIGGPA
jgi:hypothetical protein